MKKRVLCIAMIAGLGAVASVINATERIEPISTGNTGCLGSPYNAPSVDNSVTTEDGAEEDPVILSLQYPGSDIDINSLPKGIYVAKVTASNRTSTLRFTR